MRAVLIVAKNVSTIFSKRNFFNSPRRTLRRALEMRTDTQRAPTLRSQLISS
jgi:hypothetical protein